MGYVSPFKERLCLRYIAFPRGDVVFDILFYWYVFQKYELFNVSFSTEF